jgi:hypothetical protein
MKKILGDMGIAVSRSIVFQYRVATHAHASPVEGFKGEENGQKLELPSF